MKSREGTLPNKEGFYWARWQTPAPGTADEGAMCDPEAWEVVHVFYNGGPADSPHYEANMDHLHYGVFVAGVEKSQPRENFVWGPEVVLPDSIKEQEGR